MKALISLENALAEADRCVKCGLCLPHCPTYRLYADESESPRGRIALAEALLRGQLEPDAALQGHLDRCLLCRACEVHCPSGVRYAAILDSARAQLQENAPGVAVTAPDSPLMTAAARLARTLRLPGLRGRLARALPIEDQAPAPGTYPPADAPRGRIGLLIGCVTRTQQPGALQAAIRLLNALGYEVVIPDAQECCGALAAHQGDLATAQRQIEANR
ncbi:MAG: 4Fe-4S dicluster domain-containing protein, partial [Gammaproteobacteria bacterium]